MWWWLYVVVEAVHGGDGHLCVAVHGGMIVYVHGIHTYIHRYEHEAILKPKTENNIGAPSAPQKLTNMIPNGYTGKKRKLERHD